MDPAAFRVGDEIKLAPNNYYAPWGLYTLILRDEEAVARGDKLLWKGIHQVTGEEYWLDEKDMTHA